MGGGGGRPLVECEWDTDTRATSRPLGDIRNKVSRDIRACLKACCVQEMKYERAWKRAARGDEKHVVCVCVCLVLFFVFFVCILSSDLFLGARVRLSVSVGRTARAGFDHTGGGRLDHTGGEGLITQEEEGLVTQE